MKWPTHTIPLKEDWPLQLIDHIPDDAIIALEVTGYNYLRPIITALTLTGHNADIWQIPTTATKKLRELLVSGAKTDEMDARTLALAALWIERGEPPRNSYPISPEHEELTQTLRLYVNRRETLLRQRTRSLNQLDAIIHSIWPTLAQHKSTYINAARAGYISPAEMKRMPAGAVSGQQRHHIIKLAAKTPDIPCSDITRIAIEQLIADIDRYADEADAIEAYINDIIQHPIIAAVTERWQSVPSISPREIAAFHIATHCQAHRLTPAQFRASLGASPRSYVSSTLDRTGKVRKGYRPALKALHMLTIRLIRLNESIADYQQSHSLAATKTKIANKLSSIARNKNGSWK
ncbi:MAG: hypothetical protein D6712_16690 [Chloroflexi bacterium]|nr:MAG: hypothetical protein D6712_16690 [Chloroflexota bacterium]